MRKSQVFLYPLESRVAFPYHEYQVSLVSNQFDCNQLHTQPRTTTISLVLLRSWTPTSPRSRRLRASANTAPL